MFGIDDAILGSVVGGLLGGSGGGGEQTQTKSMDPRMDRYIYGDDGKGGLLGTSYNLMNQQLATGGLNPYQQQGLNMQAQFLTSPAYQQGYANMMNLGQSLMGAGVAGNPYTTGQRRLGGQSMSAIGRFSPASYTPTPVSQLTSITPQTIKTDPAPTQTTIEQALEDYMKKNKIGKYADVEDRFA